MEVQSLPCKLIEFPKANGALRGFNKEFAEKLAVAIKAEGMQHPIAVMANPEKPGYYIGVAGKHRHYAKHKVLKEELIECSILVGLDADDVEMFRISENLWRNPLNASQQLLSIQSWFKYYAAKYPDHLGRGSKAASDARWSRSETEESAAAGGDGATAEAALPAAPEGQTSFPEIVAAATGKSVTSAKRDTRIVKAFSADELEALMQMQVSQTDMLTIAGIKDGDLRSRIVALIASGLDPEPAIKEVMGDQAPARTSGMSKDDREAKAAAKVEKEPELSDDEWFDANCGDKANLLRDPARFRGDAILFRNLSELRHAFRVKAKGLIAAAKEGHQVGPWYSLVGRFINASHPKDWFLCDKCQGQGQDAHEAPCKKCMAGGYLVKTEVYL